MAYPYNNVSGFNANASYGYAATAGAYTQAGGQVIDENVVEGEATTLTLPVQIPVRQVVRTVQGPPQIQYQHIPGQVIERVEQVVIPGPVQTQQVVVPGPVVERVETLQAPDNIITKVERVEIPGPVQERIEQVIVPGPEVVKEVKVVRPGKVTERVEKYEVPGPVREEINREEYPVEGPVHVRNQPVDRPVDVVREVIQARQVPTVVRVPRVVPGPVREIYVRVHDEDLMHKNWLLRREIARLSQPAVAAPVVTQQQQVYRPVIQQQPVANVQYAGNYVAPVQNYGYTATTAAVAPVQSYGGYQAGFAAPVQSYGGYQAGFAAPVQSYGVAPVTNYGYQAGYVAPAQNVATNYTK